jgi:uncharacterized membrane protein
MYCRNCGKVVTPEAELCMSCGARPQAGKGFCPNCGASTSAIAEICVKCGAKLVASSPRKAAAILPGVSSVYNYGWKTLWPSFWILFLIGLVYFVIDGALGGFSRVLPALWVISGLFSIFVGIPLSYGQTFCYLRVARDHQVQFEELFSGFKNYLNCIGAGLLSGLIVVGGFILLIVPGIIFACKLAFVPYLVVDRKLGPVEAIQTSWKMTRGHAMEVFLIALLGVPITIAGLICLGVGVIVAAMWISMATASLYYAVADGAVNDGAFNSGAANSGGGQPIQNLPN